SNPTAWPGSGAELSTGEWRRVLGEAADVGVLHVLFSGGEPLLRRDLVHLGVAAREAGRDAKLSTSAPGLTRARADRRQGAGLDSVQISFQADEAAAGDLIAGVPAHERKRAAARIVRDLGLPLTVNVVLHRGNLGRIEALVELAEALDARRLELANVQFYG